MIDSTDFQCYIFDAGFLLDLSFEVSVRSPCPSCDANIPWPFYVRRPYAAGSEDWEYDMRYGGNNKG